MDTNDVITKVTQTLQRRDGSQIHLMVQAMTGLGLTQSYDVVAYRRKAPGDSWTMLDNRPHPDWRSMSVAEYNERGRSEVLQHVAPIEILKMTAMIGQPMTA